MRGNTAVIEVLNEVLTSALTAINQCFVHSKMCGHWGYEALRSSKYGESILQMKHADRLIDRLLLLEGVPNMQRYDPVAVGEDVPEMHQLELARALASVERLNRAIGLCRAEADHGTRTLLDSLLESEEAAVDHLEAQLELIEQAGLANYLAQQIEAGG